MGMGRGFASGLLAGAQAARMGVDLFNQQKDRDAAEAMKQEASNAMAAQPEQSQGFTAEQGDQLRAAAESGQYDIGYDENAKAYTVTPKSDPSQTGNIAMQGVTDFLGQRQAGNMSPNQINQLRSKAITNAVAKFNPIEGMRMQRESARFDREQKDWNEQDAETEDRKKVFESSKFGQNRKAFEQANSDYQKKLLEYEAAKASGKSANDLGAPPVAPTQPDYTIGDSLADRAALIDHSARHGKLDPKTFAEFTDMLSKVQGEGYEKALRLAQSGGDIQEVLKLFNSTGKAQLDPASVVSDKVVKGKDGVETRVIQLKDAQGNLKTINTVAELDALGKANTVFERFYKSEDNRRGNERLAMDAKSASINDKLRQEQVDRAAEENKGRAEMRTIREGLSAAIESGDKETEATLRKKLLLYGTGVKGGASNMSPEERRAMFYLASGAAKDETQAAQMAHEKVQSSAKDDFMTLMKPNSMGMSPKPEEIEPIMAAMHGKDWKNKMGSSANAKAPTKPTNQADAHTQAKAAIQQGASKANVNARLKELGYAELP